MSLDDIGVYDLAAALDSRRPSIAAVALLLTAPCIDNVAFSFGRSCTGDTLHRLVHNDSVPFSSRRGSRMQCE